MRPTLEYIQQKYDYFNHLIFEGKLPMPIIKLTNKRNKMGLTKAYLKKFSNGEKSLEHCTIEISTLLDFPEEEYIDTLVHEMIHYYIIYNYLADDGMHGTLIPSIMNNIIEKYGIKISIDYAYTENDFASLSKHPQYICITQFENGDYGITNSSKNKVAELWDLIPKLFHPKKVTWYLSHDPRLRKYKKVSSPTIYAFDPSLIDKYLSDAMILVKEGNEIIAIPQTQ